MSLRRSLLLLLFLLLASTRLSASGEIVLFQYPDFMGRSISLQGYTPDLENLRFNDRAASILVRSGDWEVCTDANFRGSCKVLRPGEYRQLPYDFLDRISSARAVSRSSYQSYVPPPSPASHRIELYSARRFRGGALTLTAAVADLRRQGFDDVPASAIISGGPWELCTEAGFRGTCRVFPEGRHESLSWDLAHQISSARPLPQVQERPPQTQPFPHQGSRHGASALIYEGAGFRGRALPLRGAVTDFEHLGFNDRAESLRVESGYWEFCTDADFRGQCHRLGPGDYPELERSLNRRISSARPVAEAPPNRHRHEAQPNFQFGPNAL
ncbi:MAG: beta/gamma crystallin family protein [Betaproteobacteria bacterium]|nr:beta/gamma crystallin family protein [Betaproteobacteria bacterium]